MKLHTVMVTYDRLDCTQKAIASYLETVTVPYTLIVVDNGSTDGTMEWLLENTFDCILLKENRYPGFAANRGWERAPADADFLHRADNDWAYHPGWCQQLEIAFRNPKIGQVGLRTRREEVFPNGRTVPWNVGGNNVIRRELWEAGLRYDERPWPELPPGTSEDTFLSPAVEKLGYKWTRVAQPCIYGVSVESTDDDYYVRSYTARRIYGYGR